ncbi:MAG: AraC family transcriptional regulator [Clostridium sp.]|uniref:helix-turn-helix transcriptional regulator n=1 Tax=Clostridium sp. TaxID=1506 RepID=UPI0030681E7A
MKLFDYKEEKQHGRLDFPIEFYHVDENHPRYDMPYHWHTECEIIRILRGEFLITINEEKILAKEGDIIFIHDGVLHGGTPNDCIYECIVFDIKLLLKQNHVCTKMLQDIIHHNKLINMKLPRDLRILNLNAEFLFDALGSRYNGYEFITQGSLYNFLGIILQNELFTINNRISKKTQEKMMLFKKVLSLIEENYSETITLDDLSKVAGMTPKYFCKFFQSMSNKTPIEYLNLYRIESACEQLLSTDLPITNVAMNCGFNDVSYFIKTFKRCKGITPKQYIKHIALSH